MKTDTIKELCEIAFKTYRQGGQTEAQWERWIQEQYDKVHVVSSGGTQSIIVEFDDRIVISFRGTEPTQWKDIKSDIKLFGEDTELGRVHRGFLAYFNRVKDRIWSLIKAQSRNDKKIYVTGHSLGGAAATLCAVMLENEAPVYSNNDLRDIVSGLVTFGSPRVGSFLFKRNAEQLLGSRALRVDNNNDIVPRLPPAFNLNLTGKMPFYRHCFNSLYFDRNAAPHWITQGVVAPWKVWFLKQLDRFLGYNKGDLIREHSRYLQVVRGMP